MSVTLGHFKLLAQIGKGGMAAVFRAHDPSLNREVAIKLLDEDLVENNPQYVRNFINEAQHAAAITHPNIVQIFFVGEERGNYYIVMELLTGSSLFDIIQKKGPMGEASVLKIGLQIAGALKAAYANNQMIHGDIKPQNLFITKEGKAKLLDFGLSKMANIETASTFDGSLWGSAYYIFPERVGRKAEDFRSDIYSLGATLFHALVGRPPFEANTLEELVQKRLTEKAPSLRKINSRISTATEQVIRKMLSADLFMRYLDYDSLVLDLEKAMVKCGGKSALANGTKIYLTDAAAKKSPLPLILASSVAVLVVGVGTAFYFLRSRPESFVDQALMPGTVTRPEQSPKEPPSSPAPASTPASPIAASSPEAQPAAPVATPTVTPVATPPQDVAFSVAGITPSDAQKNVAVAYKQIIVTFSTQVDKSSLDGITFSGPGVTGLKFATADPNGAVFFDIQGALQNSQTYTINVPPTVKSLSGKPFGRTQTMSFSTEPPGRTDFPEVLYGDSYAGKFISVDVGTTVDLQNTESPHSGKYAIKIKGGSNEGMVYFLAGTSDNDAGREPVNLSKYSAIEFWVKGDMDVAWVKIGHPVFDLAFTQTQVTGITGEYKRFAIPIPFPKDAIGTLFAINVLPGKTLYIDDIKFIK